MTPAQLTPILCQAFPAQGYESTSLETLASLSQIPLAELQVAYPVKELLALLVYQDLGRESLQVLAALEKDTIAQNYMRFLEARLARLTVYESMIAALFAFVMRVNPYLKPSDIWYGRQDPLFQSLHKLVQQAEDSPQQAEVADNLTLLLYTFHILVLLFWLYDRTPDKQATGHLLTFLREFFKMLRPMLIMPMVSKAIAKLAQIMMLVFGGARLVEKTPEGDS